MAWAGVAGWFGVAALVVSTLVSCGPAPVPLVDGGWVASEHYEVFVAADGSLAPLVIEPVEHGLNACLEASPSADTSGWQGAFAPAGVDAAWAGPVRRFGRSLCFAVAGLPSTPGVEVEVCGRLLDRYSGVEQRLGCASVQTAADPAAYWQVRDRLTPLLESATGWPTETLLAELDRLTEAAELAGYPFFALRLRLISVFYLRRAGEPHHLAEVERRLAELPAWIDAPLASGWAAQLAMERSSLALHGARLRDAWREARLAEHSFLVSAHPKTIAAVARQAEILALVGAVGEARERLGAALDACAGTTCHPPLLPHARSSLAWFIASDPASSRAELERAAQILHEALQEEGGIREPLERANLYVNRAYIDTRLGHDPHAPLAEARGLVASDDAGRARELGEWSDLVELLGGLHDGRLDATIAAARGLVDRTASPYLAAASWSAIGRAQRRLGDAEGAARAFDSALTLHRFQTAAHLGERIPLAPSHRAEDTYRAARLAVERGRPAAAWHYLADLDHADLVVDCAPSTEADADADADARARREALLTELVAVERPASIARREQREPIRRALLGELQSLARRDGCVVETPGSIGAAARFRAVALADETLLLERTADGDVSLVRRTALERSTLRRLLDQAEQWGGGSEAEWRRLVRPLAVALAPPDGARLAAVTTYALHGELQRVPLAALPLAGDDGWLGERTVVAIEAAGAIRRGAPVLPVAPLFVVDPLGDLAAGAEAAATYRDLFPQAVILQLEAATRARALAELERATWLHIGAHGRYEAAFPELSSIRLADGDLGAVEIASRAEHLDLANLSSCHSGRWPVTAGSGQFGLAGQLARAGVPWVIAARAELPDRLARDFNRAFYAELAAGSQIVEAYATAMRAVREAHPVGDWAGLFLLAAPETGGQTTPLANPNQVEPATVRSKLGGRE